MESILKQKATCPNIMQSCAALLLWSCPFPALGTRAQCTWQTKPEAMARDVFELYTASICSISGQLKLGTE